MHGGFRRGGRFCASYILVRSAIFSVKKPSSLDTSLCFFHWFRTNSWTSRALDFPSRWVTCIKRSSRQTTSWRGYSTRLRSWNLAFRSSELGLPVLILFDAGIFNNHDSCSCGVTVSRTRKRFGVRGLNFKKPASLKRSTLAAETVDTCPARFQISSMPRALQVIGKYFLPFSLLIAIRCG